jgi:hypothetical protein
LSPGHFVPYHPFLSNLQFLMLVAFISKATQTLLLQKGPSVCTLLFKPML